MKPKRIQRKRTKGWRMPENSISVTRPGKWGNPFKVGRDGSSEECVSKYTLLIKRNIWSHPNIRSIKEELRGKNLCCFCPIDAPCHGDVLLKLANE